MKQTRLLVDTQAFIFAAEGGLRLSPKAKLALLRSGAPLFISLISIWEIQLKLTLGKLRLPVPLSEAVQRAITQMGIELLPLQLDHIYKLADFPFHHRDPFDRLLAAQAAYEGMALVSNDNAFDAYGVHRIW
jgi:PIN domain nuclease of toxin-antitoxin system